MITNDSPAPEWDSRAEAMLHLNAVEALLGGTNGPTIRLRAEIAARFDICDAQRAEIVRLYQALTTANDQAEHFEREWYLHREDAERYRFAKTLEGQVVTMETFKCLGAEALDQALDDAMAEDADARNPAGHAA